jgi:hypothetical protein
VREGRERGPTAHSVQRGLYTAKSKEHLVRLARAKLVLRLGKRLTRADIAHLLHVSVMLLRGHTSATIIVLMRSASDVSFSSPSKKNRKKVYRLGEKEDS